MFMDMVRKMDMSFSYKPIFLLGFFAHADVSGRIELADLARYFRQFFEQRCSDGKPVEKKNSIYYSGKATDQEIINNILRYPFRRFEYMKIMSHTKTLGIIQMDASVWKKLVSSEKEEIIGICNSKLEEYFSKLEAKYS